MWQLQTEAWWKYSTRPWHRTEGEETSRWVFSILFNYSFLLFCEGKCWHGKNMLHITILPQGTCEPLRLVLTCLKQKKFQTCSSFWQSFTLHWHTARNTVCLPASSFSLMSHRILHKERKQDVNMLLSVISKHSILKWWLFHTFSYEKIWNIAPTHS